MNFQDWLARAAGAENLKSVQSQSIEFAAAWASDGPFWLLFLCVMAIGLASTFYSRTQHQITPRLRPVLGVFRAASLCLLLLLLAEPVLRLQYVQSVAPVLYVLFDGTGSMALEDELSADEVEALREATGVYPEEGRRPARQEYVQGLLREPGNLIAQLHERFRVEAFELGAGGRIQPLLTGDVASGEEFAASLAEQLSTEGKLTPLGEALVQLSGRTRRSIPHGLLMIGDFGQNAGLAPTAGGEGSPAARFGGPIYTAGIGAEAMVDLAVDLIAPPVMRVDERSSVEVLLRGEQLVGRTATVHLRRWEMGTDAEPQLVETREVTLSQAAEVARFDVVPEQTGEFEYIVEVEPLAEETVSDNNTARREVYVSDTFLRLYYVTHQPTWEWRFIKEVFHRDELVGLRGFRTYLQSSDPAVRQANPLFVETLAPARKEFFANDVIFLEDMPGESLSPRFCEMTKEFVGTFGGGLVVIAGPQYGPSGLLGTELADLLPVEPLPAGQLRDTGAFRPRLTERAAGYDFMQLGDTPTANAAGWANLGELPWYQPVQRVKRQVAEVLAEHPTDTCIDGTPQPLIVIRRYGRGQVIYIAFDEMWRIRRIYGEEYYRRFWGQMIHYLGLKRGSGSQKRFVLRTDRPRYDLEEAVTISVSAFDDNFEPLAADQLPAGALTATLRPAAAGTAAQAREFTLPQERDDRPGEFVARLNIADPGEYRLQVRDPVTGQLAETSFTVSELSLEFVNPTLNLQLMRQLAEITGGRSARLADANSLIDAIELPTSSESRYESLPLWNNWFLFGAIVSLLLLEWAVRRGAGAP